MVGLAYDPDQQQRLTCNCDGCLEILNPTRLDELVYALNLHEFPFFSQSVYTASARLGDLPPERRTVAGFQSLVIKTATEDMSRYSCNAQLVPEFSQFFSSMMEMCEYAVRAFGHSDSQALGHGNRQQCVNGVKALLAWAENHNSAVGSGKRKAKKSSR